jgi:hypothetical protein
LAKGYVLVHSRSTVDAALVMSIDDLRDFELEKIEGPPQEATQLIRRPNRNLSDLERVEEIRGLVMMTIDIVRSRPDLVEENG